MKSFLSKENRRIQILVGIAAILVAVTFYQLAVPALADLAPDQDEIDGKAAKLAKYKEVLLDKGELTEHLKALQQDLQRAENGLFAGKTPALAAAEVQKILTEIMTRNGVPVTSMRIIAPKENRDALYQTIPVQVQISADIRQLLNILYGLQASAKLLRLSEFNIRSSPNQQNEKMVINITIEGFMKTGQNT